MTGAEPSPGLLERLFRAMPEGSILSGVLAALVGITAVMLAVDFHERLSLEASRVQSTRTEPLPLDHPTPGDQIRPYLPKTIPVGPDRGEPVLPGYDGPVEGEAMAAPMRFILAGNGMMTAIGRIDTGSAKAFEAFLNGEGAGVRAITIHSPGGSVDDAVAMARMIRKRQLDTIVPADGYCASACPLLFAGGVRRSAGKDAWIGVHQVYAVGVSGADRPRDVDRSIADIQAMTAECEQLLLDMGVKPALWIRAMRTPADELYVLTEDEMRAFALVTSAGRQKPPAALKRDSAKAS